MGDFTTPSTVCSNAYLFECLRLAIQYLLQNILKTLLVGSYQATLFTIALLLLCYCYCVTVIVLLLLCYCYCVTVIVLLLLCYCYCVTVIVL